MFNETSTRTVTKVSGHNVTKNNQLKPASIKCIIHLKNDGSCAPINQSLVKESQNASRIIYPEELRWYFSYKVKLLRLSVLVIIWLGYLGSWIDGGKTFF